MAGRDNLASARLAAKETRKEEERQTPLHGKRHHLREAVFNASFGSDVSS
jgi:hypothetical protein